MRAQEEELTVRPNPHGPGLLIHAALASELPPKVHKRTAGSYLRGCGCCCCCCTEVVSWQFVTRVVEASCLAAVRSVALKERQNRCFSAITGHSRKLSGASCSCSAWGPAPAEHSNIDRSAGNEVAAEELFLSVLQCTTAAGEVTQPAAVDSHSKAGLGSDGCLLRHCC